MHVVWELQLRLIFRRDGVQIVDGCSGDLQRYREGYRAFATQTLGRTP